MPETFEERCTAHGLQVGYDDHGRAIGFWGPDVGTEGAPLLLEGDTEVVLAAIGLLVDRGAAPVRRLGLVVSGPAPGTGIAVRGRWRFDFTPGPRAAKPSDPMLTYAMTALAADKQARLAGARATFARVEVVPNTVGVVPERVSGWLEAWSRTEPELDALVAGIRQQSSQRSERDGTVLEVSAEPVTWLVGRDVRPETLATALER